MNVAALPPGRAAKTSKDKGENEYNWVPVDSTVSQALLLLLIAEREFKRTLLFPVAESGRDEKFDGKVWKFELRSVGEEDDCCVKETQEAFTTAIIGTRIKETAVYYFPLGFVGILLFFILLWDF